MARIGSSARTKTVKGNKGKGQADMRAAIKNYPKARSYTQTPKGVVVKSASPRKGKVAPKKVVARKRPRGS